jgi:tRNA-2-methylthio-N6-dimethylallyladenosine synthase
MERLRILNDRQREIQREHYARHLNQTVEVMIESYNPARGQIVGRSTQNKTVNFTLALGAPQPPIGSYLPIHITRTMPNCLIGEAVPGVIPFEATRQPQPFIVLN